MGFIISVILIMAGIAGWATILAWLREMVAVPWWLSPIGGMAIGAGIGWPIVATFLRIKSDGEK